MLRILFFSLLFLMLSSFCFAEIPRKTLLALPNINSGAPQIIKDFKYGHIQGNGASPWYSSLSLGTPSQKQKYLMDTGTNFSWVTSSYCNTPAGNLHTKFYVKKSKTYKQIGDPKNPKTFHFGPWGDLSAYLGKDKLTINNVIFPFLIYFATSYSGEQFEKLLQDAGVAFQCDFYNEEEKKYDLLKSLKNNSYINHEIVSFIADYANRKGSCIMGTLDHNTINEKRLNAMAVDKGKDWRYQYQYFPEM